MNRIFVIGSVNTDLVIHAPYLPKKGETLTGDGFFTAHGGKGANQAVAAARAGGKVVMCACVGCDRFGEEAIAAFEAEEIHCDNVSAKKHLPTGTAVILVIDGDNRIVLDRGANAALTREDVDRALSSAERGDLLLVQLENPIEVIGYALTAAKKRGLFTVLNPAPADCNILPYLKECDLLIPNETEAEILGGREFLSGQVKELIVTLGGDGYEVYRDGKKTSFPCFDVPVVDTTGAGDTFCGSLCTRLAQGEPLFHAAEYAAAAAALACSRRGAQPSIPRKEEIERFLAAIKERGKKI